MSSRIENMAVITVNINDQYVDEITDPSVVYDLIVDAITEWVDTTEEGFKEWTDSSNDFNVGDLTNLPDDVLLPYLNSRGIDSIEIETASNGAMHYYDQILCNHDNSCRRLK
jgi:hypothetical protein